MKVESFAEIVFAAFLYLSRKGINRFHTMMLHSDLVLRKLADSIRWAGGVGKPYSENALQCATRG